LASSCRRIAQLVGSDSNASSAPSCRPVLLCDRRTVRHGYASLDSDRGPRVGLSILPIRFAMREGRRLVAIVFTDVVGFTSFAHSDEPAALQFVREERDLATQSAEARHGRLVKSIGDGLLFEFRNALEAVEFAVALQRQTREKSLPKSAPKLTLRIGVHLGDVEGDAGDILGDAVNIASRIEPLAEPGGICLSEAVYAQVRNHLPYHFEKLGTKELKGIREPIGVYRTLLPWNPVASVAQEPNVSRIAVLPLVNMSPDPGDAFFADGLTEELITQLSAFPDLRVIARTSVMRYRDSPKGVTEIGRELRVGRVLEGSVRKSGNRLRVTAQLIDAESDEHLWAQQYDRQLTDLLDLQSEISREVAVALRVRLRSPSDLPGTSAASVSAHTAYLRGRYLYHQSVPTTVRKALETFEEVIREDPRHARAYAGIADCCVLLIAYDQLPEAQGMERARTSARRALELEPLLAEGHVALADVEFEDLDLASSEAHFLRAIEIQPGLSRAHSEYSGLLASQGRIREAAREAGLAEGTDPADPSVIGWIGYLAWMEGDTERALGQWREWSKLTGRNGRMDRMSYYALLGDRDAARAELESLIESVDPHIHHWVPFWRAFLAALLGEPSAADAHLDEYMSKAAAICSHRYLRAAVYGLLEDQDRTFAALGPPEDRAMGGWEYMFRTHPGYVRMRRDPRFPDYARPWDPPPGHRSMDS